MATKKQMDRLNRVRTTLQSDRMRYDQIWKEIAKYITPYHGDWSTGSPLEEGLPSVREIYDNVGIKASNRLADGIQGYACGRTISWFRLAFESDDLNESDDNKGFLQKSERSMYTTLAASNFYDESRAFLKCAADFGTAVMLREDNKKRSLPCYKTLHPKHVLLQEDSFGEVDTLFREIWMDTETAMDYFGKKSLPLSIRLCDEPTKMWRFFHYIGPSYRYELDVPGTDPYIGVYWSECELSHVIREERYEYKPFFALRWARSSTGEVWGVDAPGMLEISNIRQLNSMQKDKVRLSQLKARPPIRRTEGLLVNFVPGAIIDVRPGQDFATTEITGDLAWLTDDMDRMKASVRESFYSDFFLVLTENIERMKTATEVMGLQDEKSALLASFFGRLSSEFLEPVLEDLFASELRYGRLPSPPESIADNDLKIDFVSPLAMIQKRAHELSNTKAFMDQILPMAQIAPAILDKVDMDKYIEVMADASAVRSEVLRKVEKVEEIRQARAKLQAQQAQRQMMLEQAKVSADVMAKGGKAPEKGSPVANANA